MFAMESGFSEWHPTILMVRCAAAHTYSGLVNTEAGAWPSFHTLTTPGKPGHPPSVRQMRDLVALALHPASG
jgi:hypothetical protein